MASGSGTNAENLLRYAHENEIYDVECVLTDQPGAGVISRVEKFNVDCFVVPVKKSSPNEPFLTAKKRQEQKILKIFEERKVDWIFLAGYMRILTPEFIQQFWDKNNQKSQIINIHPALLPDFPGANAYEQAWNAGVKTSGVTVHHVDSGVDTGPIILQESFDRLSDDSFNNFKNRGMDIEYGLYIKAIKHLFSAENAHE